MLHAQKKEANWDSLSLLRVGDRIQVREKHSTTIAGTFLNVSDAAISLQANGAAESVPKAEVFSVKLMRNNHRLRNTLIAAGVGAGVGAGIGAATHHGCSSSQSFCLDIGGRGLPTAIGAVVGLLGGGAVGALLPSHETIYGPNAH
jgi:hypothetical protein